MERFDEQQREGAPMRMSQKEIEDIVRKIDDPRLSATEDNEHFVITYSEGKRYIPKRKKIKAQNEEGIYVHIDIDKYLQEQLDELE